MAPNILINAQTTMSPKVIETTTAREKAGLTLLNGLILHKAIELPALLEYERHKRPSGELELPVATLPEASVIDNERNWVHDDNWKCVVGYVCQVLLLGYEDECKIATTQNYTLGFNA
ncbi:Uncharacterized protein Fot_12692 [Forsythia ovata]|uniref:Uncharacterized protein n=1 Tax=Forsythia ovata TaxID=205694 RepID=A0ABD1WNP9_9LAMI